MGDLRADRVLVRAAAPEGHHGTDDVQLLAIRERHALGKVVVCDDVGDVGVLPQGLLRVLGNAGLSGVRVDVTVLVDASHTPLGLAVGAPTEVERLAPARGSRDHAEPADAAHGLVHRDGVNRGHVEDGDPTSVVPVRAPPDEAAATSVDRVVAHREAERPRGEAAAAGGAVKPGTSDLRGVVDRADDPGNTSGEEKVVHPGNRVGVVHTGATRKIFGPEGPLLVVSPLRPLPNLPPLRDKQGASPQPVHVVCGDQFRNRRGKWIAGGILGPGDDPQILDPARK
mmetsp:Transcript_82091/g.259040  ORF Transcript_82091/g.259040 Transcript_82091/m.259040 type:complete len:284 (+) Transcript_82091:1461-2312(+)